MNKCFRALLLIGMFIFLWDVQADAQSFSVKKVTVIDNGMEAVYSTSKDTVEEFLKEQALTLGKEDKLNVNLTDLIMPDMSISIEHQKNIILQVNDKCMTTKTYASTVDVFLKEQNIKIGNKDWLNTDVQDPIYPYMHIHIKTYTEKQEGEFVEIPFKTEIRKTNHLPIGQTRVVQQGKIGHLQRTWKVSYLGEEEQERMQVSETVIEQPVSCIIEEGAQVLTLGKEQIIVEKDALILSNGQTIPYSKVLNMSATAYTASYESTGKRPGHPYFGMTYSGTRAKVGTVAVDPRVIPLGTKLYVEGYGFATAEDIGGAVKGNIIDLYMDSHSQVRAFGRQKRKVYVLK
ncbi:MAG: DUF348 domain-containing protein [Epulopiscium sp.]|nr:DUF348 domain-containing protein [Candidatus Epulonipiscium sp.]